MKIALFASALLLSPVALLAQASTNASPASSPAAAQPEIVVTGRRLSDTERALAECLKRKCPPDEDINASLAHAENLFVAGEYTRARSTTKASLARNRKEAAKYPVPVSDLERANGRISSHLGEGYDYQYSTWGIRRALKQGLPDSDPRLVGANLEIADMLIQTGRTDLARKTYADADRDALRIGRRDLAATARLRAAYLDYLQEDRFNSRKKLEVIAKSTDPMERVPAMSARILLARMDRKEGRADTSDALIRDMAALNLKQPAMIYAPPIELVSQALRSGGSVTGQMATDTFTDRWVDVGFWVKPDGRVSELEILRESGTTDWAKPLLKSIGGRIYTSSDANGPDGVYRVERYSYTSFWGAQTGTRIRQRGADARVEFLDLTADPDAANAKR